MPFQRMCIYKNIHHAFSCLDVVFFSATIYMYTKYRGTFRSQAGISIGPALSFGVVSSNPSLLRTHRRARTLEIITSTCAGAQYPFWRRPSRLECPSTTEHTYPTCVYTHTHGWNVWGHKWICVSLLVSKKNVLWSWRYLAPTRAGRAYQMS